MAQKIRDDKIGALSHSAGNILMAASIASPAYLTIGGQQFKVTTQLSVAVGSLTANTRYQIYAVQSAGVVSLVISLRENSLGPVGYSRWKLVGSILSNYLGAFGAFINIKGVPRCAQFDNGPIGLQATGGGAVKGTTTEDLYRLSMDGQFAYIEYRYKQTVAGSAGSGSYLFDMPVNVPIDITKTGIFTTAMTAGASDVRAATAFAFTGGFGTNTGTGSEVPHNGMSPVAFSASQFRIAGGFTDGSSTSVWGSGLHGFSNANTNCSGWARVPISTWTNNPIEDL